MCVVFLCIHMYVHMNMAVLRKEKVHVCLMVYLYYLKCGFTWRSTRSDRLQEGRKSMGCLAWVLLQVILGFFKGSLDMDS